MSNLFIGAICYFVLHILLWFSFNLQLMESWKDKAFYVMLALAIPASMLSYYGVKYTYSSVGESAWGARFVGSGMSYLVFPILTWVMLNESMFTLKTMLCVLLSIAIILVQIFVE